jgi:uncharacterized protein
VIVLDTTVLVYAVGEEHPLAESCRALIGEIGRGRVRATTTVEVLQEFAHVRARRRSHEDAAALTRSYAQLLAPLLTVGSDDLSAGLDLFVSNPDVGAFDAVLLATAARNGAAAVVSTDQAMVDATELRVLLPGSPGFLDDVRSVGGP